MYDFFHNPDRYPDEDLSEPTPYEMVKEFHEVFDLPIDAEPTEKLRHLRYSLIEEEFNEASEELYPEYFTWEHLADSWEKDPVTQKEKLAKELADAVYVLYGAAVELGIDLDEAVRRVHFSNMSKLDSDGKPIKRDDGKILKGPYYYEPDMTGVTR